MLDTRTILNLAADLGVLSGEELERAIADIERHYGPDAAEAAEAISGADDLEILLDEEAA